jgi:hypothetical protein
MAERCPDGFRDEQQYLAVERVLERWGRLENDAFIFEDRQSVMSSFITWLGSPLKWRNGKPLSSMELRTGLNEAVVGELYNLLAALRTGPGAIDAWAKKNAADDQR